jgi:hypothetical protein
MPWRSYLIGSSTFVGFTPRAGSKVPDAGYLRRSDGMPVEFVAYPKSAPKNTSVHFAQPDDIAENGRTWREQLSEYNNDCAASSRVVTTMRQSQFNSSKTWRGCLNEIGVSSRVSVWQAAKSFTTLQSWKIGLGRSLAQEASQSVRAGWRSYLRVFVSTRGR